MSEPRRTPLYDVHVAAGGRIVDFAGWSLPVQYDGIVAEQKSTRAARSAARRARHGVVAERRTRARHGVENMPSCLFFF